MPWRPLSPSNLALVSGLLAACAMPNPEFDGVADGTDGDPTTASSGDGDGDPTTSSSGDGDGDPNSGDGDTTDTDDTGDGDPNSGDGDGDTFECAGDKIRCGDACVDLDIDNLNCGDCGVTCAGGTLCGLGTCLPKRYVFVSSLPVLPSFGGIAGGDGLCNELASVASLPGTYKAWLSDAEQSPVETFVGVDAVYVLPNGAVAAYSWDDLVDGEVATQIKINELGLPIPLTPYPDCNIDFAVWTGTTQAGHAAEDTCFGWSTSSAEVFGAIGNPTSLTSWSQIDCIAPCSLALPIYCVQQ